MIAQITKTITGVDKSRVASNEIRDQLLKESFSSETVLLSERFSICASCEFLKEELKIFGKTIKQNIPVCGKCGCSVKAKASISIEHCPIKKW
jgi:hypothetical protein